MPDLPFAEMLSLLLRDVGAVAAFESVEAGLRLRVSDLIVEIPASISVNRLDDSETKLMLTLPSLRDATPQRQLGRVRVEVTIEGGSTSADSDAGTGDKNG